MRDTIGMRDDVREFFIDELIEGVTVLEKISKEQLVKFIKEEMVWARQRYDEGGADYAERIEFAGFYFELSDILEEIYSINEYKESEIGDLKLKIKRAYSSLRSSVSI